MIWRANTWQGEKLKSIQLYAEYILALSSFNFSISGLLEGNILASIELVSNKNKKFGARFVINLLNGILFY